LGCPRCGGEARSPIAPGYWRCESVTDFYDPNMPYNRGRRVCGTEYQEGSPGATESCRCGTFAIGRCGNCGNPSCGRHSKLDGTETRICDSCWTVVARRHEKQRAAQLTAMPTAGVEQLIALCHGEMRRDHKAEDTYPGLRGILLTNGGGDTYVVRAPMQGKVIAAALIELKASTFVTVAKKSFGREQATDHGWMIWSWTAPDDRHYPEDRYYMDRDGTVKKIIPRYERRGKSGSDMAEVIPADWYWSRSVVWGVFACVWLHPDWSVQVGAGFAELPLYAQLPSAWEC
jgi:hypothetical protein